MIFYTNLHLEETPELTPVEDELPVPGGYKASFRYATRINPMKSEIVTMTIRGRSEEDARTRVMALLNHISRGEMTCVGSDFDEL